MSQCSMFLVRRSRGHEAGLLTSSPTGPWSVVRGCGSRQKDFREVLDCGSPLPLFPPQGRRTQSARGLAQSKALARNSPGVLSVCIRVYPWFNFRFFSTTDGHGWTRIKAFNCNGFNAKSRRSQGARGGKRAFRRQNVTILLWVGRRCCAAGRAAARPYQWISCTR
jgi:hypothetical protein